MTKTEEERNLEVSSPHARGCTEADKFRVWLRNLFPARAGVYRCFQRENEKKFKLPWKYRLHDWKRKMVVVFRVYLNIPENPDECCHCGTLIYDHKCEEHGFMPINCCCGYGEKCPVHPDAWKRNKRDRKGEV